MSLLPNAPLWLRLALNCQVRFTENWVYCLNIYHSGVQLFAPRPVISTYYNPTIPI